MHAHCGSSLNLHSSHGHLHVSCALCALLLISSISPFISFLVIPLITSWINTERSSAEDLGTLAENNSSTGTVWTARPDSRENWLNSTQWRDATQLRLGWNDADDLRCNYTNRQEEVRDKFIGRGPLHALDCKHSPARIKIHNSVCKALREQLRRLGADVEEECPVVELSRWWLEFGEWKCQEALLDLSVRWPGAWIPRRLLDITVRDPEADRYQPTAQHILETIVERAHEEKNVRYTAARGSCGDNPATTIGQSGQTGTDGDRSDCCGCLHDPRRRVSSTERGAADPTSDGIHTDHGVWRPRWLKKLEEAECNHGSGEQTPDWACSAKEHEKEMLPEETMQQREVLCRDSISMEACGQKQREALLRRSLQRQDSWADECHSERACDRLPEVRFFFIGTACFVFLCPCCLSFFS